MRDRKLKHLKPFLEGRDMDDWMVVDMNDIIVNIFDERRYPCTIVAALHCSWYAWQRRGECLIWRTCMGT